MNKQRRNRRVIKCINRRGQLDEPLYWSNSFGWTNLLSCDVFTEQEQLDLNLPLGGEWVEAQLIVQE
jgi:hypothetical protein